MTKGVILITGCSSGLGRALAERLSQKYTVYGSMRRPEKLKGQRLPFIPIRLDVLERESIEEAMETIEKREGRIDVLINNAGIMLMGLFEDVSEKELREIFETNFFGLTNVTKAALPLLDRSKRAKIVNISSTSGVMPMPALSAYAASKWAVEGFSESLRFELKSRNIAVLLIEPGLIRTELLDENFNVRMDDDSKGAPIMRTLLHKWNTLDPSKFLDPKKVAELIEKRIEQKNPKFRTLISSLSYLKLFIKRAFPHSLYEKIVLRALEIDSK